MTYVWTLASPLGELTLRSDGEALTGVSMPSHKGRPAVAPDARRDAGPFAAAVEQLQAYFAAERREFELPITMAGTPFLHRVWAALQTIPYGHTASYRDIAEQIGSPKAVRAVGLANGRNPVAIVVPCHRVVGANGALTGYGGGLTNKRYLLDLERRGTRANPTLLDQLA